MDYQEKYLKYKNKYLTLKNQMLGGGKDDVEYHLTFCDHLKQTLNVNGIPRSYNVMSGNNIRINNGNEIINMDKNYYNGLARQADGNCNRNIKPDYKCMDAFGPILGQYDVHKFANEYDFNKACVKNLEEDEVEKYQRERREEILAEEAKKAEK